MGELKTLNQALLLQVGQRALHVQVHRAPQDLQCMGVVLKALLPADVWCFGNGKLPFSGTFAE